MVNLYPYIPQAVILMTGGNELGVATKAKIRACIEEMLTDVAAIWEKIKPAKNNRLGLFISLVPPKLWYKGFTQQKAGREARSGLNSHMGKIAKQLGITVIPHPILSAEERWFSDPQHNSTKLSEPGYDILIQDICLALTTRMQFSEDAEQREVALNYFHVQAQLQTLPKSSPTKKKHRTNTAKAGRSDTETTLGGSSWFHHKTAHEHYFINCFSNACFSAVCCQFLGDCLVFRVVRHAATGTWYQF